MYQKLAPSPVKKCLKPKYCIPSTLMQQSLIKLMTLKSKRQAD